MNNKIVNFAINDPKKVFWLTGFLFVIFAAVIPFITVDTDPENMLSYDNPSREAHRSIKQSFSLSDIIIVGVVNESHSNGVYNSRTISEMGKLTKEIQKIEGVLSHDVLSLSVADNIAQGEQNSIVFNWLIKRGESLNEDLSKVKEAVNRLPLLKNTLVSEDHKVAAIYIPITEKGQSYRISNEVSKIIDSLGSFDEFMITGLPVGEDTFGVEMFKQMAVSGPLASLLIFALLWFFFRNIQLAIAPLIICTVIVVMTMGLLIGTGFTVHIMSSMIPVFLMPIAVVDSVHIISEFTDRYKSKSMSPEVVIQSVIKDLYRPMLFTTITTAIGFASLALVPIPPLQVFGVFVAVGVLFAFVITLLFLPAYIIFIKSSLLAKDSRLNGSNTIDLITNKGLNFIQNNSLKRARITIFLFVVVSIIFSIGVTRIVVNDNPIKWFEPEHPIRYADTVLNKHFSGTYNAFLQIKYNTPESEKKALYQELDELIAKEANQLEGMSSLWAEMVNKNRNDHFLTELEGISESLDEHLFSDDTWQDIDVILQNKIIEQKVFLSHSVLSYMEGLESHLDSVSNVGKTNGFVDLIKTLNREFRSGDSRDYQIPEDPKANSQLVLSFLGSHRPHDLWHMVTKDFQSAVIWLQLKSGDNQDMQTVVDAVDAYINTHPLPKNMDIEWGGLTYINLVWQEAMVSGMVKSLIGAYVLIFISMAILFRSVAFGAIGMLPLTVTLCVIYGAIGYAKIDFDMPIAILSALALGLSIDFAIHLIDRSRAIYAACQDWQKTLVDLFNEPCRAILKNAIIVAVGFTPLLLSSLVPYQTVGVLMSTILLCSCITTLLLLPAIFQVVNRFLYKSEVVKGTDGIPSAR